MYSRLQLSVQPATPDSYQLNSHSCVDSTVSVHRYYITGMTGLGDCFRLKRTVSICRATDSMPPLSSKSFTAASHRSASLRARVPIQTATMRTFRYRPPPPLPPPPPPTHPPPPPVPLASPSRRPVSVVKSVDSPISVDSADTCTNRRWPRIYNSSIPVNH